MSPHQATSGSPGAKSWLTRSGRGGLSSDQSVVRIRLRSMTPTRSWSRMIRSVRVWSMTRAAASVRNSFGYLPRRRPGVGLSSVTTGMTTSYSRCPASGGMLRGIAAVERARNHTSRLKKIWCDGGFKKAFVSSCGAHHISAEVVNKIHDHRFEVLPRRWVVERTWSWLMNNRRLQVDYERNPIVTEGFVWAAHARLLLRRLTDPAIG